VTRIKAGWIVFGLGERHWSGRALISGPLAFVIEPLWGPRPIDAMTDRHPDEFVKLSREPGFMTSD
jgi:hypothetical protein